MRLKGIDLVFVQDQLRVTKKEAEKIRAELGLILPMTQRQLFKAISQKLTSLHFKVLFTNKLHDVQGYGHLPSITIFNHPSKREKGGRIYIYDKYSINKKRELLYHEFVHINDTLTPTFSTDRIGLYNGYMLLKSNLESVELKTELTSTELMMPYEQIEVDLFDFLYDIEKVVKKYSFIEISKILEWITLHDYFAGHYAVLFFTQDTKASEIMFKIDEYCYANSKFDIMNILLNTNSIAYKSKDDQMPRSGVSVIDNREYYCFSFYEKNIQQPLPASPIEKIIICDKLSIIGWPKDTYDFIQRLKLKDKN